MRHRISIQKLKKCKNELNQTTKEWFNYDTCWASKVQLKGINDNSQGKLGTEYTYRFKVRYRNDLDESMRILFDNVVYDIVSINNIKETSMYETHIDCIHHKEGVYDE